MKKSGISSQDCIHVWLSMHVLYMVYNGCTDTSSRCTHACTVVCIYRRSANFLALLYHYRMWLMRRLTQPRVSCYYSPWRTGPPVPSLSLVLSRPFPFHYCSRGRNALSCPHMIPGPWEWARFWRWFIHSINPGPVSAGFGYCFSNSHARKA